MVVNHLSTSLSGGAAVAARRLHHGLRQIGVDSRFWHLRRNSEVDKDPTYQVMRWAESSGTMWQRAGWSIAEATFKPWQKRQLHKALHGRPDGLELFSSPFRTRATTLPAQEHQPNIVHLHWVSNLIDYPSFFQSLSPELPVVWSLHDMNPLTGGCHYSQGCERFTSACQCCPQLGQPHPDDLSNRFFQAKRQSLSGHNLHLVANSRWMEQQARRSRIMDCARSFRTIHYCLDTETFRPHNKYQARRQLGLPENGPLVAFGAESCQNRRKGFQELLRALSISHRTVPFTTVTFGEPDQSLETTNQLSNIKMLGFVHDEQRLAQVYSAADVFVVPSLEEALGQTGVEAMACGVPVVAFDVGGLRDYVIPKQTGMLAECGNVVDLARHIVWLLQHPSRRLEMGRRARQFVQQRFNMTTQATKYRSLYEQLNHERLDLQAA